MSSVSVLQPKEPVPVIPKTRKVASVFNEDEVRLLSGEGGGGAYLYTAESLFWTTGKYVLDVNLVLFYLLSKSCFQEGFFIWNTIDIV